MNIARMLTGAILAALIGTTLALVPTTAAEARPAKELKVISRNIAGGLIHNGSPAALKPINRQINKWGPDIVTMNEVCRSQYDTFRRQRPGWAMRFKAMRKYYWRCKGPLGNVVASRTSLWKTTTTNLGGHGAGRRFYLLCAHTRTRAGKVRACTTHLRIRYQGETKKHNRTMKARQVRKIKRTLQPFHRRGLTVTLSGDLNLRPGAKLMNHLYRVRGRGFFHEADQTDRRRRPTRTGAPTAGLPPTRKIDYVFFSTNNVGGRAVSGGVVNDGTSDHSLVRGRARVRR